MYKILIFVGLWTGATVMISSTYYILANTRTDFLYPEDVEVLNNMEIRTDKAFVITKPSDFEEFRRRHTQE